MGEIDQISPINKAIATAPRQPSLASRHVVTVLKLPEAHYSQAGKMVRAYEDPLCKELPIVDHLAHASEQNLGEPVVQVEIKVPPMYWRGGANEVRDFTNYMIVRQSDGTEGILINGDRVLILEGEIIPVSNSLPDPAVTQASNEPVIMGEISNDQNAVSRQWIKPLTGQELENVKKAA